MTLHRSKRCCKRLALDQIIGNIPLFTCQATLMPSLPNYLQQLRENLWVTSSLEPLHCLKIPENDYSIIRQQINHNARLHDCMSRVHFNRSSNNIERSFTCHLNLSTAFSTMTLAQTTQDAGDSQNGFMRRCHCSRFFSTLSPKGI